jgi:predicted anti-sigma-YlaC factor YlaD
MSCERWKELMMASLDGEISPQDREDLDRHLAACENCRREFKELGDVTHLVGSIRLPRPSEEDMMKYWPSVYARIERGMGWGLLIVGVVIWVAYGVYAFLTNPAMEALTKLLVALPVVGVLVLLVSVIRERYHVSKTERYGEVER